MNNYLNQKKIHSIIIFILFFCQSIPIFSQADQKENLFYKIHKSDDSQLILEVTIPQLQTEFKNNFHIVSIPGYNQMREAGKPQLPYKSFVIGIPLNCTARLEILEADFQDRFSE